MLYSSAGTFQVESGSRTVIYSPHRKAGWGFRHSRFGPLNRQTSYLSL